MKYKIFNLNPSYGTNTYLTWDETTLDACLIDPASAGKKVMEFIKDKKLKPKFIINTHCHYDHIGGNDYYKNGLNVPIYASKDAASAINNPQKNLSAYVGEEVKSPKADKVISHGDILKLGKSELKIIATPGHSTCGISIYSDGLLFSGDTLFAESVGRADLPGGNMNILIQSIKKHLFILPQSTIVLPGHGPATTIEDEKVGNPFVGFAAKL